MEVTFSASETEEIIVNGMEAMGFNNIDPSSLDVAVKSPRDGSGKSHISVSFERMKNVVQEFDPPQRELVEADKPSDDTTEDSLADTEEESSDAGAGLFTGGATS